MALHPGLQTLGLARVKKLPPKTVLVPGKLLDRDAVAAIIAGRFSVMSRYAKMLLSQVWAEELRRVDTSQALTAASRQGAHGAGGVDDEPRGARAAASDPGAQPGLATVYRHKQRLQAIWQERSMSHDGLLHALEEWCREAEQSGIRALRDFARTLPSYSLARA